MRLSSSLWSLLTAGSFATLCNARYESHYPLSRLKRKDPPQPRALKADAETDFDNRFLVPENLEDSDSTSSPSSSLSISENSTITSSAASVTALTKSTKIPATSVKSTKAPKSEKSTKAPTKSSKAEASTKAPTKSSKASVKSTKAPSAKSSKNAGKSGTTEDDDAMEEIRVFEGYYSRLVHYSYSCTSKHSCIDVLDAYCLGGMNVQQEFDVDELGKVALAFDLSWDFRGSTPRCGQILLHPQRLVGLGWLPVELTNSFECYEGDVSAILEFPSTGSYPFAATLELQWPNGTIVTAEILSGVVCETFSEDGEYTQVNEYALLAVVPGFSLSIKYQMNETTFEVLNILTDTPHLAISKDDSWGTGKWDYLHVDKDTVK